MTDELQQEERRAVDGIGVSFVRHERRKGWHTPEDCVQLLSTRERLDDGAARMERIETQVCVISAAQEKSATNFKRIEAKLDDNSAMNEELLGIVRAGKGFFRVAGWVATAVKWAAGLALPLIGLYLTIREGLHK